MNLNHTALTCYRQVIFRMCGSRREADILAIKDGISYAVQCKRYDKPVGVFAVQQIYAGRDYYGCMVGAVMTNQTFTPAAKDCAKKLRILLWDRSKIEEMQQWQERAFSHRKKS